MATKPKGAAKPKQEKGPSRAEFNELMTGVSELAGLVKEVLNKPSVPSAETPVVLDKESTKATANKYTVNPEWEDLAREIIGEAVDHTEVQYIKGGGLMFTVVIKEEFSNSPTDYLERYKVDRRSKEVGAEGEAGVRIWCEQIRNNLKKPKPQSID